VRLPLYESFQHIYIAYPSRLSAQELLECSFLAVEPDVLILENDPSHTIVALQVVFKGSDKLSVKFEFNTVKIFDV
jgi:hypothetical protein